MEPINVFARLADPVGVARLLRELAPGVTIDGPDDSWRSAVVPFGTGRKRRTLTFNHDPAYYSGPGWSQQMSGMSGYFARFPETDRKARVLLLPTTFRFALATQFDPDFDPAGDPRLDVLFAVAELLDGVLFTPSSLRDAQGRVLFGSGGEDEEDPDAIWPKVIAEVSLPTPTATAGEPSGFELVDADDNAEPPTAERVARRALALTAVTLRAILEQDAAAPDTCELHEEVLTWWRDLHIDDELEPEEWEVLQRPVGKLGEQSQVVATWRLEGLVVLAWSLGRLEIPPHDELVKGRPLWRSLGWRAPDVARALLATPTLRPRAEIATLRERLFALHWRLRNYYLRPEVMDFAEFARTCRFGPLDITGLPLAEGDLALQGQRIDRAARDVFATAHSTAQERHQAANWLCDGPALYSEASVAT